MQEEDTLINKERIVDEFCELVSIDAPTYRERKLADVLTNKLEALGFTVTEDQAGTEIGGDCGNLFATLPGTLKGEPLLFSAHMDTVTPAIGKRAIVHENGKITSGGDTVLGADDVAGIVSILEGIRSLIEDKTPHRSIELFFAVAEEVFSKGCYAFDQNKIQAKEAFILDLSGKVGRAAFQAPSIISFECQIQGKAAHAGFCPETGKHAIMIASRAIARLELGKTKDGMTVNIGTIQGGEAVNIVPERCLIKGEVRGFDHEAALAKVEQIRQVFTKETEEIGAKLVWETIVNCKSYQMNPLDLPGERYSSACKMAGLEPSFEVTYGGSDFNILAQRGMIGLVLSNAMNDVHSCEEHSHADELVKSAQIVSFIMCDPR